jgi:hypothetical protein
MIPAHLSSRKGIAVIAFIMPLWCLRRAIAIVSARHRHMSDRFPSRATYLLPDLPQELADGLADYYAEAIEAGVYSCDGGSAEAAKTDLAVLSRAGQLQGTPDELKVEDFWYLEPLARMELPAK